MVLIAGRSRVGSQLLTRGHSVSPLTLSLHDIWCCLLWYLALCCSPALTAPGPKSRNDVTFPFNQRLHQAHHLGCHRLHLISKTSNSSPSPPFRAKKFIGIPLTAAICTGSSLCVTRRFFADLRAPCIFCLHPYLICNFTASNRSPFDRCTNALTGHGMHQHGFVLPPGDPRTPSLNKTFHCRVITPSLVRLFQVCESERCQQTWRLEL